MATTYEERRTEKERKADALVKERVLRGIELLRDKHGDDFADHINLDDLDLRDGNLCVLGQLYGTFQRGVHLLLDDAWEEGGLYGFYARSSETDDRAPLDQPLGGREPTDEDWEELNQAWLEALTPRVTRGG